MEIDGYIRVSRVGGRSGESFISPELQREQISAWARLRGVSIAAWHVDLDESGGKIDRPGFNAALERCEAGATGGIAVAKIDRFARSLSGALETIARLDACDAQFVSVAEGIDPTTPAGKMLQRLMLVLAEFELDRIRENWRAAQERAVARGVHVASATPTGYVRSEDGTLQPHPEWGQAIGQAFALRASGGSWREVQDLMQRAGVVGPYGGKRWTARAVQHIIANRVYLGEARSGAFTNPHAHPPLTDRATFAAAQGARTVAAPRGDGALLSGILRCAGCRYVMKPDTMKLRNGERVRIYRCRGEHASGRCDARAAVLGSVVEPVVVAWFLESLGDIEGRAKQASLEREAAQRALDAAEAELAAFRDEEIVGVLGKTRYLDGLRDRVERTRRAEEALAALGMPAELPDRATLDGVWPTLTVAERRRLLAAGIDAVFIRSGRGLAIRDRIVIFGHGDGPGDLPRPGHRIALAPLVWPDIPDGAGVALTQDLGEDAGD